jgi:hypothetical protein
VVAAAELLNLAKVKEDIKKLLFNFVFLAIFVNNVNPQSEPPFRTSDRGRSSSLLSFFW